jgi:sulfotransferase
MTDFHVLCGLPRSGSTLLCDILNQRDDVFASSTSALPGALVHMSTYLTGSVEVTSELIGNPAYRAAHHDVMEAIVDNWHPRGSYDVVIDKSRAWATQTPLLAAVKPDAKILCTVRDPRDVLASIERTHQATGIYGAATGGVVARVLQQVAAEGIVGSNILAIEDMIRRGIQTTAFFRYEDLTSDPTSAMKAVEGVLELAEFDYDFDAVTSTANDADELYRYKFNHHYTDSRLVEENGTSWSETINDEQLMNNVLATFPAFCQRFGYE